MFFREESLDQHVYAPKLFPDADLGHFSCVEIMGPTRGILNLGAQDEVQIRAPNWGPNLVANFRPCHLGLKLGPNFGPRISIWDLVPNLGPH